MLSLSCSNEEKIKVSVVPVTSAGNPAALDGPINVTVQSGDGTVEIVSDVSFFVVSGSTLGDSVFLVEADADLGDGVVTISDLITLSVEGALAVNLGLVAEAPVPK